MDKRITKRRSYTMKKIVALLLVSMFVFSLAFAGEGYFKKKCGTTEPVTQASDVEKLSSLTAGVGADIVLWQNKKEAPILQAINAEYRYSVNANKNWKDYINEGEHSAYLVVVVNVQNLVEGLMGK